MNLYELWRPSVTAYLNEPGRKMVTGMELARACGKLTYDTMDLEGWRTLAALVKASGWRKGAVGAVPVWVAPTPVQP